MRLSDLSELRQRGHLNEKQYAWLARIYSGEFISLFYEIRALLYVGVLSFTTGAGILLYKHTETLGHSINILLLTMVMLACFAYATKHRPPYTHAEVESPTPYYDYALLLGALLFASIEGYLQAVYNIFGQQWGLAGLIPAVVFFVMAYLYDHRGILALAITATAAAIGLEVSAINWFANNVFSEEALIFPSVALGVGVIGAAALLRRAGIKVHFTFTYLLWGATFIFAGMLGAVISFEPTSLYCLTLMIVSVVAMRYALQTATFVFYLYGAVFGYIGLTVLLTSLVDLGALFWYLYFIISCGGLVYFITRSLKTFRVST